MSERFLTPGLIETHTAGVRAVQNELPLRWGDAIQQDLFHQQWGRLIKRGILPGSIVGCSFTADMVEDVRKRMPGLEYFNPSEIDYDGRKIPVRFTAKDTLPEKFHGNSELDSWNGDLWGDQEILRVYQDRISFDFRERISQPVTDFINDKTLALLVRSFEWKPIPFIKPADPIREHIQEDPRYLQIVYRLFTDLPGVQGK